MCTPTDHQKCLACDYSLRGLPDAYRCPECGLKYDLNRAVYGSTHSGSLLIGLFIAEMMLFGSLALASSDRYLLALLVFLATAIPIFGINYLRKLNKKSVILSTHEIDLLLRSKDSQTFTWDQIKRIDWISHESAVGICDHNEQWLKTIPYSVFGSRQDAQVFVRAANQQLEKTTHSATSDPATTQTPAQCPACGDSLDAQSNESNCPKCKIPYCYNVQTFAYKTSNKAIGAGFVIMVLGLVMSFARDSFISWRGFVAILMGLLFIGHTVYKSKNPSRVVTTSRGFLLEMGPKKQHFITWDIVHTINWSQSHISVPRVDFVDANGKTLCTIKYVFFGSLARTKEFVAAAKKCKALHDKGLVPSKTSQH